MSRFRPFDPSEGGPFRPRDVREFTLPTPPRRFWIGLALVGIALLLLFITSPIVVLLTDLSWYRALGLDSVYVTRVVIQAQLFWGSMLFAVIFGAINVGIATRLRSGPNLAAIGIGGVRSRPRRGLAVVGGVAVVVIALIVSAGAGSQWQNLVLFLHYSASGQTEPVFRLDVSFYLLILPLLHSIVGWGLGLLFLSLILVVGLHAWRGDTFDIHLTHGGIGHVSVILALLAAVFGFDAWIGRYDLLSSHNSVVWGAGYTDVHARIGLAIFATAFAAILALALLANTVWGRVWLPPAAAGAWVLLGVVGGVYPGIVQRFVVAPQELSLEAPYIQREIEGTRRAFGIDGITTRDYGGDKALTAQDVAGDRATVDNLRLWDYRPLLDTYTQLQTIRTYYSFHDVDLDRYTLGGKYQQLEVSARELQTSKLPAQAQGWVNQRLQYTHGYGVAASPVNAVAGEGLPQYVAGDLPPTGPLKIDRPAIYFGETNDNYVLAPSKQPEFDFPSPTGENHTEYSGSHGVRMSGADRWLWALRLGDLNLLISPQVQDRTELLFRRTITSRAAEIAPFLVLDRDPYITVVDGRLYWIQDAYTSASTYPYSQQEESGVNYLRNSVKIVTDPYEGTQTYYVADSRDPLIRAYAAAFPKLFSPLSDMPAALRSHIRVPEDLFTVQANVYRTYHITEPTTFYNREDVWEIPNEQTSPGATQPIEPYYVLMRLPGESQAEYVMFIPFVPRGKQNLVSWMAARSDAPHYGELIGFNLPRDKVIYGPQQVGNRINQNPAISRDFSLLNQSGSRVQTGNLLVVPVGNAFLYFEPVYLVATGQQSLPELKKVILADAANVAYADTLQAALDQITGAATGPPGGGGGGGGTGGTGGTGGAGNSAQVQALVADALKHYNAAQDRLKAGDLAGYASEMAIVASDLQQIQQLTGVPAASPSPSPSPAKPGN